MLLDAFQKSEVQRLTVVAQRLRHYLKVTQDLNASHDKNVANVYTVCNNIDPDSEIQTFVNKHRTGQRRLCPITLVLCSVVFGCRSIGELCGVRRSVCREQQSASTARVPGVSRSSVVFR